MISKGAFYRKLYAEDLQTPADPAGLLQTLFLPQAGHQESLPHLPLQEGSWDSKPIKRMGSAPGT